MKNYTLLTNEEKNALVQRAMELGAEYEKKYSNCAQCTMAAVSDVFPDIGINDDIFTSGYSFGGGFGCFARGTCGALNGIGMVIATVMGRHRIHMDTIEDECFDVAHNTAKTFYEKYGGVCCCDVQKSLFNGKFYDFYNGGSEGYNTNGGHEACATVCAYAAGLAAQMIIDGTIHEKDGK